MTSYTLDACALIALLKGENGAVKVDDFFQQAARGEAMLYISIVNLLEVYYGFIKDIGLAETTNMLNTIDNTPLTVIDTTSHAEAMLKYTGLELSQII